MDGTGLYAASKQFISDSCAAAKQYFKETIDEIAFECLPSNPDGAADTMQKLFRNITQMFHIPHSPAFTRPGWLVSKFFGPYDTTYMEGMYGDIFAGFTVGMTMIPQALSYATLASLPPINGLYSVILSSVCYIFLGTGMQLSVGPVALVSLLMGQLITQYDIDYNTHPETALNFAAEAAFCSGLLMFTMGIFNLGKLIRFVAHPVLAGFTTASAIIISLNQIKNGFGFSDEAEVPQVGGEVHYNYEVMGWYLHNWNGRTDDGYLYRNVHATNITIGIYIPLLLLSLFKNHYKFSDDTKKTIPYQIFNFVAAMATLISLIIAARMAYLTLSQNNTFHAQTLKVVGDVPAGLHIFRFPEFEFPLGQVFLDVLPLTIIAYMESYAVARRTASVRGQLSTLNASQELVALGVCNLSNTIASGYPVCGSFSRSSLYLNCGAVTPMATAVTLVVVLVAVSSLTHTLYYIPQAALAAVVMVAVFGLIDFYEFWVAWKVCKQDFFVMVVTFVFTFVLDTEIGLIVGVATSLLVLLKDMAFAPEIKPESNSFNFRGVDIVRLNSNMIFVSADTMKDTIIDEIFTKNKDVVAVVLDFANVKQADLSGVSALREVFEYAKKRDTVVFISNVSPLVQAMLDRAAVRGALPSEVKDDHMRAVVMAALALVGQVPVHALTEQSLSLFTELVSLTEATNLFEMVARPGEQKEFVCKSSSSKNASGVEMTSITPCTADDAYDIECARSSESKDA